MKKFINIMHCAHLDLFWMGSQDTCLNWGAGIIDDAVRYALEDGQFHFFIETVRFVEYYLHVHPERKEDLLNLLHTGQIEVGADYIDKLEASHDGESLIRNIHYGKKLLRELLGVDTVLSYHPDLPGTTEQTPQIFKKSGIEYYLAARGFKLGARFYWKALDGTSVIMYNFPIHYSYYNVEKDVIDHLSDVRREIGSEDVAMNFSAGDLGPADSFIKRLESDKRDRVKLRDYIHELNDKYPQLHFRLANILSALEAMDKNTLKEMDGENSSRWGHNASALHVQMLMLDKRVSAALMDAEKYATISALLGLPVQDLAFERHLLAHGGNSGGKRKYFELRKTPATVKECIDAGWIYQLVTQDHNYGGIEGAQTEFDRFIYKNAALAMAATIKNRAIAAITSLIDAKEKGLAVFNSMNWVRSETVRFEDKTLCPDKEYSAVDASGIGVPVLYRDHAFYFAAQNVPSVGYKTFRIREQKALACHNACQIAVTHDHITLENTFYKVQICRKTGVLTKLYDRMLDKDLLGGDSFLEVSAYEDMSCSVNDTVVDKPLLDTSTRHVNSVEVLHSNYMETVVRIVTEILNCKLTIDVGLNHLKKELRVNPTLYWCAIPNLQIKMNFDLPAALDKRLVYGVPYGAQIYGHPLEHGVIFKTDEISDILYARYREVEKWFAMEGEDFAVSIASNQSAYDFAGTSVRGTMMRNVSNIGDTGVQFTNKGIHPYQYVITSYQGSWEDGVYRKGWELQQPLDVAAVSKKSGPLPGGAHSFFDTHENGVMTVLKPAEAKEGAYVARIFNATSCALELPLANTLGLGTAYVCNLMDEKTDEPSGVLSGFEIKSLMLEKNP